MQPPASTASRSSTLIALARSRRRFAASGFTARSRHPRLCRGRVAALVEIQIVEHRQDRQALESALGDALREEVGADVAPAPFHHETIPDLVLFVGVRAAPLFGPGEDLLVRRIPVEHARLQVVVFDSQEIEAAAVETDAEIL